MKRAAPSPAPVHRRNFWNFPDRRSTRNENRGGTAPGRRWTFQEGQPDEETDDQLLRKGKGIFKRYREMMFRKVMTAITAKEGRKEPLQTGGEPAGHFLHDGIERTFFEIL